MRLVFAIAYMLYSPTLFLSNLVNRGRTLASVTDRVL
jgi:hypothetical protein